MNLRLYYHGPALARIDRGLLVAYILSGFLTTVADYGTFTLLFSVYPQGLFEATVAAYIAGLVVSYLLNRFWVFRKNASRQGESTTLWRYLTFLAVNLGITYAMLWSLETYLGISPYVGKFIVGIFMFFWIYLGDTYFVYKGPKMGPIKL